MGMEEFVNATKQDTKTVFLDEAITLEFESQVALIVNTASECGFTEQYAGLQELYNKYKDQGFTVLAYPANNFRQQEPGTDAEIKQFCETKFGITFPIMPKSDVIGDNTNPLYNALFVGTGIAPKWNFHKYLISRNGKTVVSFDHFVEPIDLVQTIETLLKD